MWHYTEKEGNPKKDGEYLVSAIAEKWLIDQENYPERYTTYAYWDSETNNWSNGDGYDYNVYAWDMTIEPAEPLDNKNWRIFFCQEESSWKIVYEYCKKYNLEFEWHSDELDYCVVDILCTLIQEERIDELIERNEQNENTISYYRV